MHNIEVKILNHSLNGMSKFLAKLTQRGHEIESMDDLCDLLTSTYFTSPSETLMSLPHTTLRRMNYLTVAITGLSTKAVSQLRTHATRLSFVSTSTQYSSYEARKDNWFIPSGLDEASSDKMLNAYKKVQEAYNELIEQGVDKDAVSYMLPQGLRKALVISGSLDAWQYVLSLRMCKRNTVEVQYISKLIYDEISNVCGKVYAIGMLPACAYGPCPEGKFSCGKPFPRGEK